MSDYIDEFLETKQREIYRLIAELTKIEMQRDDLLNTCRGAISHAKDNVAHYGGRGEPTGHFRQVIQNIERDINKIEKGESK